MKSANIHSPHLVRGMKKRKLIMDKSIKDKDPFTGENSKDIRCPVCGIWVWNVQKYASVQVDPEHAVLIVHLL